MYNEEETRREKEIIVRKTKGVRVGERERHTGNNYKNKNPSDSSSSSSSVSSSLVLFSLSGLSFFPLNQKIW